MKKIVGINTATVLALLSTGLYINMAANAATCTYFTATNGNDSNPGTLSLPFRTVNRGVRPLQPGQTLCIRVGLYAEELYKSVVPSGTSWSQPVTIQAYSGEKVTLQPPTGSNAVLWLVYPQRYIVFDGLVLDGINGELEGVRLWGSGGEVGTEPDHIRIQNSEIKNAKHSGIAGGNYIELINSSIHHNGRWGGCADGGPYKGTCFPDQPPGYGRAHGFYLSGANNLIDGCDFYWNGEYGVHGYNGPKPTASHHNIVRNTRMHDNGHNTTRHAVANYPGMILSSGEGSAAYNNLVYNNTGGGIDLDYGDINSRVFNNTVVGNSYGIKIGTGSSGAVIKNNIVFGNGTDTIANSGGAILSNNLVGVDPAFVSLSGTDFHLQSRSPAIDTGVAISEVTTDFDGNARPAGSAYDIGAFEYGGLTVPAPLPSTTFKIGQRVQVVAYSPVNVRGSPAGILLGAQPAGALGTVVGGPVESLLPDDGVVYVYWQIDYDSGVDGWSGEILLEPSTAPVPGPVGDVTAPTVTITSPANDAIIPRVK
jgi:parallel beta-helix repeat protein